MKAKAFTNYLSPCDIPNESFVPLYRQVESEEENIINRREILPSLAKARQILDFYSAALRCSAVVVDSLGNVVKTTENHGEDTEQKDNAFFTSGKSGSPLSGDKQVRFCEFCIEHTQSSSPEGSGILCRKAHLAALLKSHQADAIYVYDCPAGFIFWTSPLSRNGRYAGALTAGRVILDGRNTVLKRFRTLCKDTDAVGEFSVMLKDAPEKTLKQIKSMAELLGLCAEEVSDRKEEPSHLIRRRIWQKANSKPHAILREKPVKARAHAIGVKAPETDTKSAQNSSRQRRPVVQRGLLEKERMLIAAFKRGDNEAGNKILKELLAYAMEAEGSIKEAGSFQVAENMDNLRFRALELLVLLSRSGNSNIQARAGGRLLARSSLPQVTSGDSIPENNNRFLARILESKTVEELTENLLGSAERLASKIFSFQGLRHASALRRAERFIWENYTRKLNLEEIAKASGLSAPYFSTIFKEEMGENLSSYLNRLRVERTITLLTETEKPLSEIAKLCGFEDQSWFSKIFKSFTGLSPGKFREAGGGIVGRS